MYNRDVRQFRVHSVEECPYRRLFKPLERVNFFGELPKPRFYCGVDKDFMTCEDPNDPWEPPFPKGCHLQTAYYPDDDW